MQLTDLKGISFKRKLLLEKLNVFSIGDLVSLFPRKYKDLSTFTTLDQALFNEKEEMLVKATVIGFERFRTKGRKSVLKIKIQDETATAYLLAFNQPFLMKSLVVGEEYNIIGIFSFQYQEIQASSFQIEKEQTKNLNYGRIVPYYPLTEGVSQKWLRDIIYQAIQKICASLPENLPQSLTEKRQLISRAEALKEIHFPSSFDKLEQAKKRLKYFELFKLEFQMALKKFLFQKTKNREYINLNLHQEFLKTLPFSLTDGQQRAFMDIQKDMLSKTPMHRLLQGDVGAGKTLVSVLTLLVAIGSGYQGALMVPTEVLALQHFEKITKMLKPLGIKTALLVSSVKGKERQELIDSLESGEINLLIGTHSLFSEDVKYKNLAAVVIDEQHKFGVMQRASIIEKGENPDILIMTATPIPRTLGISLFGDMDISIIPDKPAGRKPINTIWVSEKKLDSVFDFVKTELNQKHQGYIVYPLIEDSEKLDLKSVATMFEKIKNEYLKGYEIVLLHGRMSELEKEESMQAFTSGKAQVLVATTVIEVGVDVANASFMVIENAHRFGLSTLHQLRGRIGRSDIPSTCYLVTPQKISEEAQFRMKAMKETDDGFALSQKDLEIRGTGNFLGTSQKGFQGLKLASLIYDYALLEQAREDAFLIVSADLHVQKPEHHYFKGWYNAFCKTYHQLLRT